MANNKVQLANGTVLIDITDTTANAFDVLSGKYFYNASGVKTEGSLIIPSTYTVTKTLTNVTTSNNDTEVLSGGSFYMDLTPSSGMVINSIIVTMGGVDVTEQVFSSQLETYSITENLTRVISSNSVSKVISGGSFYAVIEPMNDGEIISEVIVTMGGVDVTEQVFKGETE